MRLIPADTRPPNAPRKERAYGEAEARSSTDGWHFEQRSSTEPVDAKDACSCAGDRYRDQAPWPPLEQQ